MNRSYQEILDTAARPYVPDNIDLFPLIAAKLERKTLMQTLRARPMLALLIVLLILSLLSGVVYAIGRSLGYLPGVGIVEQGSPIRVLAEPVSVERDGITLTITDAVLTADKTVIVYTIENVPWEALSHREDVPGCYSDGNIRLSDESQLTPISGSGGVDASGRWETRMVYSPVPPEINDAEFLLDCIRETLPGLAPENWELSLRFVPAPPDMQIMPVVEIPASIPNAPNETPADKGFILEKIIETESGYILVGKFHDASLPDNVQAFGFSDWPTVFDANGIKLPYWPANDVDAISTTIGEFPWTLEIKGKAQAWPLTIQLSTIDILHLDIAGQFTFDAGQNPQPGQEWILEKDVPLGNFSVRVEKATLTNSGYLFNFNLTAAPDVQSLELTIANTISLSSSASGDGQGNLTVSVDYEQPPSGVLTVQLSYPILTLHGNWSLQWAPENAPEAASLYGISLKLDQFIPLDDGYYLIGHTEWTDERIADASPAGWGMKAYDANGQEVPLEPAMFEADTAITQNLAPNQWAYHLYGQNFNDPLTLRATQMGVSFANPVRMSLDLHPYGFEFDDDRLDSIWRISPISLDVPDIQASAFQATYMKEGDLRGFQIDIMAEPALEGLGFRIESGLDTNGMYSVAGGGGSYRDKTTGVVHVTATTNTRMNFPLVFVADSALINGDWSATWTPPASNADGGPATVEQACVTLEKWKQATGSPAAIPPGLPEKVLITRGALFPDPSLFLSSLDGSNEQGLAFRQGSLSPDGTKLVYSDENNRLLILDIASGQKTVLTDGFTPLWSLDGEKIAFIRQTEKGMNVFVMEADGQNPRALTNTTELLSLSGWNNDGRLLIQSGNKIEFLDVINGNRQTVLVTEYDSYGSSSATLSPDGQWLAYLERVTGRMAPGIYISRPDGSEKRLLVQLDYWVVFQPLFSPDGKWLAINVMNSDLPNTPVTPALVNLETCQIVPLPGLNGTIAGWNYK